MRPQENSSPTEIWVNTASVGSVRSLPWSPWAAVVDGAPVATGWDWCSRLGIDRSTLESNAASMAARDLPVWPASRIAPVERADFERAHERNGRIASRLWAIMLDKTEANCQTI